ncbi:MAG: hypothetical protein QOJ59_1870 [Thermomicrobiales bacterium]|jgi:uncharacterized protein (TIGR02271 family)|nr:hypothetical protein [Thermomicrobiales bacterium]
MTDAGHPRSEAERLTIQRHEEVLEPVVREVERGSVRIHTRVETVPSEITVEAGHDEVVVERVPVDRQVDAAPSPRQEGDTLVIPVVEEVLVVEKRLVVREEVRITRRRVTTAVPIRETVRREVVEVEEPAPTVGASEGA